MFIIGAGGGVLLFPSKSDESSLNPGTPPNKLGLIYMGSTFCQPGLANGQVPTLLWPFGAQVVPGSGVESKHFRRSVSNQIRFPVEGWLTQRISSLQIRFPEGWLTLARILWGSFPFGQCQSPDFFRISQASTSRLSGR